MSTAIQHTPESAPESPADTVWLTLPDARGVTARRVIREMARWSVSLPDAVRVVVVTVVPSDALTVELVTGFAISRRLLGHRGRQLVLRVTGAPQSPSARALLESSVPVMWPAAST